MSRSRKFFITVNKDLEAVAEKLKKEDYKFLMIGAVEKAPTTGHEHYHACIEYDNAKSMAVMLRKFKGIGDIQPAKGTYEQIKNYCSKDGKIQFEAGEEPHQGRPSITAAELKKMTISEIAEAVPLPQLEKYVKCRDILNSRFTLEDLDKKEMRVIWISGKSGRGKSYKASQFIKAELQKDERYKNGACEKPKFKNGFWIGVCEARGAAWYDDFRDTDMKPVDLIEFIDYNVNTMNVKGGYKQNRYDFITITSVYGPMDIYKNCRDKHETALQWKRRINEWYVYNRDGTLTDKTAELKANVEKEMNEKSESEELEDDLL